jgi:hypothetical protein
MCMSAGEGTSRLCWLLFAVTDSRLGGSVVAGKVPAQQSSTQCVYQLRYWHRSMMESINNKENKPFYHLGSCRSGVEFQMPAQRSVRVVRLSCLKVVSCNCRDQAMTRP